METEAFLVIGGRWQYRRWHAKISKVYQKKPALADNEICVKVSIELPDGIFVKPAFETKIVVPDEHVMHPEIDAVVADNIAQSISDQLGVKVNVSIKEEEDDAVCDKG